MGFMEEAKKKKKDFDACLEIMEETTIKFEDERARMIEDASHKIFSIFTEYADLYVRPDKHMHTIQLDETFSVNIFNAIEYTNQGHGDNEKVQKTFITLGESEKKHYLLSDNNRIQELRKSFPDDHFHLLEDDVTIMVARNFNILQSKLEGYLHEQLIQAIGDLNHQHNSYLDALSALKEFTKEEK
jgi:hypothetical protein